MPYLKIILIIITLSLLNMVQLEAQEVRVDAQLDTNSILIGDQVNFRLNMQIPEDTQFLWPFFQDTLTGKIEIVKKSPVDTLKMGNGYLSVDQALTLTVFDSGYYVIPPISFLYGDELQSSAETEPYLLNVFTVNVDTTQAIKPIKGPMRAPLTLSEILPWALGGLAALLVAGYLLWFFILKRKNKPITISRPKPKIPPHRIALDALEQLNNEKLWQSGRIKEYHSRVTDIIRDYIEHNFRIRATEMTTWEIIQSFSGAKIERKNLEILRTMLELADLVKFAKFKPLPDENIKSMNSAVAFVKNTTEISTENNAVEKRVKSAAAVEAE